jgi:hypothetical protein
MVFMENSPTLKIFYYILHACILEGALCVDLYHLDLIIMTILVDILRYFACMHLGGHILC